MSTTPANPTPHTIGESDGRQNSRPKIKAPFMLRSMNQPGMRQMIWLWSRRGKRWVLDQVLSFDFMQGQKLGDS